MCDKHSVRPPRTPEELLAEKEKRMWSKTVKEIDEEIGSIQEDSIR